MDLKELGRNWNRFGKQDPLWAIISYPEKKGGKWAPEDFFQMGRDEISLLYKYLAGLNLPLPRQHALDFGCGVGRLSQALAADFDMVSGVDIAPSMIKLARRYNRYEHRCRYFLNERDDLSLFPDNRFDFVISLITLQHIHPRYIRQYLIDFLRVLSPSGVLYFQLPSQYLGKNITASPGKNMSAGGKLRQAAKDVIPEPLLGLYRMVRDMRKEPIMEMYGIERGEVEALLEAHGGVIVDVVERISTFSDWKSYCYCVTKSRPSGSLNSERGT